METPVDTLLNQRISRTPFHHLGPVNDLGAHNTPHLLDHHTEWLRTPLYAEMFTPKFYCHTQRQSSFVGMSKIVRFFQCPAAKLLILVCNHLFSTFGLFGFGFGLVFFPKLNNKKIYEFLFIFILVMLMRIFKSPF